MAVVTDYLAPSFARAFDVDTAAGARLAAFLGEEVARDYHRLLAEPAFLPHPALPSFLCRSLSPRHLPPLVVTLALEGAR